MQERREKKKLFLVPGPSPSAARNLQPKVGGYKVPPLLTHTNTCRRHSFQIKEGGLRISTEIAPIVEEGGYVTSRVSVSQ
jgi:hypothetical protein